VIVLTLYISTDLQILDAEEQQRAKRGKLFWEWSNPHGVFDIHYLEKGEGSNHVILLHGFRAHTFTWKKIIEPLSAAGYHVWAMDLVGYGLSDKPDNIPYTFELFSQQIHDFMNAKGISQAHIVGNSMGGGLALRLAIDFPDRLKSLTLISALGYPLDIPLYISICRHISQIWAPFLGPTSIRSCLKEIVYDQNAVSEEQVEAYCLPYQFNGGITSTLLTMRQFDNQELIDMGHQYSSLKHPIAIIWGDHDTLIPLEHYEKFLKDFPQAYHKLITHCGHIPQEERPDAVLASMIEFLHQVDDVP
jgi:pimeloyl-ACP methyl ester carboxylesterase